MFIMKRGLLSPNTWESLLQMCPLSILFPKSPRKCLRLPWSPKKVQHYSVTWGEEQSELRGIKMLKPTKQNKNPASEGRGCLPWAHWDGCPARAQLGGSGPLRARAQALIRSFPSLPVQPSWAPNPAWTTSPAVAPWLGPLWPLTSSY